MGLTKYKLGDLIDVYNQSCGIPNLTIYDVSGINRDKEFFEPSKQVGEDTSKYKIVPPEYFACNLMHVGRDVVLPIAFNHSGNNKYVSPAYTVFSIKADSNILKTYFLMMLKSSEKDRFFWFHTDSSVRDGMSWDDFCDMEIELPDFPIQKKYVSIYEGMLQSQQCYERGLEDLKLTIDAVMEKFKHNTMCAPLGELIEESDARNGDESITSVHGVNKDKKFMPSVASGADLSKYKIVRKNQFACNLMHVGRDKVVPVALQTEESSLIVSPAYLVFEVKTSKMLPEFLLMWLSREETDRYAWFMCDTNVRSGMEKKRFFEIDIPIPSIVEQEALVELFHALTMRRNINEKLKTQIKNVCPILIRGSMKAV